MEKHGECIMNGASQGSMRFNFLGSPELVLMDPFKIGMFNDSEILWFSTLLGNLCLISHHSQCPKCKLLSTMPFSQQQHWFLDQNTHSLSYVESLLPLYNLEQKFSVKLCLDKQVSECPWNAVLGSAACSECPFSVHGLLGLSRIALLEHRGITQ